MAHRLADVAGYIRALEAQLGVLYGHLSDEFGEAGEGQPWEDMEEARQLLEQGAIFKAELRNLEVTHDEMVARAWEMEHGPGV